MKKMFKKPNKTSITFGITCFILGLFLILALHTQASSNSTSTSNKNQDLLAIISTLENDNKFLEDEIANGLKEIEGITGSTNPNLKAMEEQNKLMSEKNGQTELKGGGITITLNDDVVASDSAKNSPGYDPEDYIVHDKNLLYLVNDMRFVAKGIAINNQRVVVSSDIRCVGTVIMVNQARLAPPYNIHIIGDSNLLEETLKKSTEYNYIKQKNIKLSISKNQDMTIPAFTGITKTDYTKIYEEGE